MMILHENTQIIAILIVLFAMGVGIASADTGEVAASQEQGPFMELRLTADDAEPEYGRSVAIANDLVAVGAGGDGAVGAVYLYRRQGMQYIPEATLVFPEEIPYTCPGDFETCPEFGRTVAIQGDTVLVGARFAPVGELKAGAVYVFQKHGDAWQCNDKIVSPAPEAGDNFGRALAIQGNLLVVTARKSSLEEGAAYVFEYRGGRWIHQASLAASDSTPGAYFDQSVAIQGELMAIGARNADPNGAGGFYLFRRAGDAWMEVAKVTPPNGNNEDQYGFAIAIAGDTIVVSARRADPAGLKNAGEGYVYSVKGGAVTLVTRLAASDAMPGDEFGQSVAIAGDVIAVGAWKDDATRGSIYLFRRMGDQWTEINKITASDGVSGDEFGYSLSVSGNRLVTGAHKADSKAGAAYIIPLKP